jgi:hypothetical protein
VAVDQPNDGRHHYGTAELVSAFDQWVVNRRWLDDVGRRWIVRRFVAAAAAQRIARLLFMIGLAVAAYFALSVFDHAARADEGLKDRLGNADPPASVEKLAVDAEKDGAATSVTQRKGSAAQVEKDSASRTAGRKAVALKVERRKAVAPKPKGRKAAVPTVRERRIPAPVVNTRVVSALKADDRRVSTSRVEVRKASVLRADAARVSARHGMAGRTLPVAAAIVTERLKDPKITAERDAFAARALAAVPGLPALAQLPVNWKDPAPPGLPVVGALPTRPAVPSVPLPPVPSRPSSPAADQSLAPPTGRQAAPLSASTPMALPTPPSVSDLSAARVRCDLTEQAGVRHDGTGLSPAPTTPPPTSPPHPGDHSAGAGHLRDSGGGIAPPMGTVPSSWWPEIPAAAVPSPANASTPGRTVRYCGPPS